MTTTKAAHTPGPWRSIWNGAYGYLIHGSSSTPSSLAVVSGVAPGISTDEAKANVRLIENAPDTMDALELLLRTLGPDTKGSIHLAVLNATAVIQKARGGQ